MPVPQASAETTPGLDKIREQGIDLSQETMSLIRRKIRAGTHTLTRIRNGRRQIRFLLDEVTALAEMQENNSAGTGPTKKQEENGHRRSLTL